MSNKEMTLGEKCKKIVDLSLAMGMNEALIAMANATEKASAQASELLFQARGLAQIDPEKSLEMTLGVNEAMKSLTDWNDFTLGVVAKYVSEFQKQNELETKK